MGAPHPSDTRPGPDGRWALSSQADTGRVWILSGGWCCTGLPCGTAGSDTCPPCDTGGLGRGGKRCSEAPEAPSHSPGASHLLLPVPPHASPFPLCHTCAARWAEAGEGAHTVDAGGSWGTGGSDTVIQVLLTACPSPATHTHAVEATSRVLAGSPISAARGTLGLTFIHIFRAIPACGVWEGDKGWSWEPHGEGRPGADHLGHCCH